MADVRDLGQAEHWYRHSLDHRASQDHLGRAKTLAALGGLAERRFLEARAAHAPEQVLLGHLNQALDGYQQALGLLPANDAEDLAAVHHQLGVIYHHAGDTRRALHYYQQSIRHEETRGNTYGAGQTRLAITVLLQADGRPSDALLYARAALHDFERAGPGAASAAFQVRDLITRLEQDTG